jgi:GT2 family glycosyltransferase/glycosyltransferase involved in cell wall biosynthesis/Tfp pilus assembly protein PilF
MIKTSIIIPIYNQLNYTKLCLEYLEKNTDLSDVEIIIVDNGSFDGTQNFFKKTDKYKYFRNSENYGFPYAVNKGIRNSRGQFYVILNNDVLVTKNWLNRLFEVINENEKSGLIGPTTNWISGIQMDECADYTDIESMEKYAENIWKNFKGKYIIYPRLRGFCLLIKKEVVDTIGGFDERFKLGNYEDDDFCLRASNAGFLCAVAQGIFVHHFGSITFKNIDVSYYDILNENRKKFIEKWGFDPENRSIDISKSPVIKEFKEKVYSEKDIQSLFEKGNELAISGQIDEAIAVYDEILKINPNHTETLYNLACLEYEKGFIEKALKILHNAVKLDTNFAQAYNTIGLINYALGEKEIALRNFKNAISKNINYDEAFGNYFNTATELGISVANKIADFVFYTVGMKFDGNTIYEKGLGGSETALFYIARELTKMGYSVKVFNNCENPGIYEGVEYGDLTDFYIFNRFNKIKVFISSRSFKPYFSNINAEKKVLWIHDHFDVAFLDDYDFGKISLKDIEFFTLSKWQTNMWKEGLNLPDEKFYITRNGFNPEFFNIEGIKRNKYKLIYSSRPERGLEILLDLFPEIRKCVPEAELHVFAYVPFSEDKEMKPLLEKLNQPNVIIRGSVTQSQLAVEMMQSRVMAYPNIWRETSCITAIESQAAGLPIVSSTLAAIPETIINEETGILIEGNPNSAEYKERFVREVVELIKNDEKWECLSKNGRKRAFEFYTWRKIAEEWVEKFRDLFEDTRKREVKNLSLCMIVKNEEKNLPISLESVKNIVDEMIIVDTGSTDNTIKIAENYGAKIYHFDWCDDFSEARNYALSKAQGRWILYIDADERIDEQNCKKILNVIKGDDIMAVSMNLHTPQEEGNLFKCVALDYCRLFRNHPQIRFEGKIHEQILPSINRINGKVLKSDIVIDHFGYGSSKEKREERLNRNVNIIKNALVENPNDPFMHFYLAKTYRLIGKDDLAIKEFKKVVYLNKNDLKDRIVAEVYTALSQIYLKFENLKFSKKYALRAIELAEYEILPLYILATIDFLEENFFDSLTKLEKIRQSVEDMSRKALSGVIDISQIYEDIGNCKFKLNDFNSAEENYKKVISLNNEKYTAHFNFGNVLFSNGKIEDALKEFEKVLKIKENFEPAQKNIKCCRKILMEKELV